MFDFLDIEHLFDGLLFGMGIALLWLGGVVGVGIARSVSVTLGTGFLFAGKIGWGWWNHCRRTEPIINVTVNTARNNKLAIDTIVSDRPLATVWSNSWHLQLIRRACKKCTAENPVVWVPSEHGHHILYGPIISLIAEAIGNEGSVDFAVGKDRREYEFVVAITFEQHEDDRVRHMRVMIVSRDDISRFALDHHLHIDPCGRISRFNTLKIIATQFRQTPERFGIVSVWR